jgi:acyl carrier protein
MLEKDKLLQYILDWLKSKNKDIIGECQNFFHTIIDSLELIQLINDIEVDFNCRILLNHLTLSDLESIDCFVQALEKIAINDEKRIWYDIDLNNINAARRMWVLMGLRAQLPNDTIIKQSKEEIILVGIPQNSTIKKEDIIKIIKKIEGENNEKL